MFEDLLVNFGYVGLFFVSFLASTIFPLGSEVFIILMLGLDFNPSIIFIVATIGNYLGALTNYYIGKYGAKFFFSKYHKIDPKKLQKSHDLFEKYGAPILFFSWVPIIGDPLCIIPGILKTKIKIFSFWVILGKATRYLFIILLYLKFV